MYIVDLDNLINKIDFDERQLKILNMWRNGVSVDFIAKELNVKQNTVSFLINTIVGMIVKQYEEDYEDWYYLNISKGEYKKCSRCGKVKLTKYFKRNGNRLRSNCKKCE